MAPTPTPVVISELDPICGCNALGEPHTVTLTLLVNGLPAENVPVNFLIISGPNEGLEDTIPTNANGQASFTWTSDAVGLDIIVASGLFGDVFFENQAMKCWVEAATPTPSATPSPSPSLSPSPSPSPTPSPSPSPSPSPTPSPTPTVSATPTPTGTPFLFTFACDDLGWRFYAPDPFDHPTSSNTPGNPGVLSILSNGNTNSFGYWESPAIELGGAQPRLAPAGSTPYSEGLDPNSSLFSATFLVRSNLSDPSKVPQFRLRTTSVTYEESHMLVVDSRDDGIFSPGNQDSRMYQMLFSPTSGSSQFTFDFDMLNFNPMDAANAELMLDHVVLQRFDLSLTEPRTHVKTYTFEDDAMGWTAHNIAGMSPPAFSRTNGTLATQGTSAQNVGGYWGSSGSDIPLVPGKIYIATFDVESDVPESQRTQVPQLRCRLNETSFHLASIAAVESKSGALGSPTAESPHTYTVFFSAPDTISGQGLVASFDYLNLGAVDQANSSLFLRRVKIETLPNPLAPFAMRADSDDSRASSSGLTSRGRPLSQASDGAIPEEYLNTIDCRPID